MLEIIAYTIGIALLAAGLTGPFVWFAFVPAERRKREAAEGRATGLQAELAATRQRAQRDIEGVWKRVGHLQKELNEWHERDTIPTSVPEVPRRAKTDTLVSE